MHGINNRMCIIFLLSPWWPMENCVHFPKPQRSERTHIYSMRIQAYSVNSGHLKESFLSLGEIKGSSSLDPWRQDSNPEAIPWSSKVDGMLEAQRRELLGHIENRRKVYHPRPLREYVVCSKCLIIILGKTGSLFEILSLLSSELASHISIQKPSCTAQCNIN